MLSSKPRSPAPGKGVAKVALASRLHGLGRPPLSRSHALRGNLEAPRRGEHQAGVTIRTHDGNQTCQLSGVIRCGPEGVCSDPYRQLVMGSVSRPEDGGPSRPGTAASCRPLGLPTFRWPFRLSGKTCNAELPIQLVISQAYHANLHDMDSRRFTRFVVSVKISVICGHKRQCDLYGPPHRHRQHQSQVDPR